MILPTIDPYESLRRIKAAAIGANPATVDNSSPMLARMGDGYAFSTPQGRRDDFDRAGVKAAATEPVSATPVFSGSLSRLAPSVSLQPSDANVVRSSSLTPAPNTISRAGQAEYQAPIQNASSVPFGDTGRMRAGFLDGTMNVGYDQPMRVGGDQSMSPDGGRPMSPYSRLTSPGPAQRDLERVQAEGPKPAHGWGRVGRVLLQLGLGNPVGAAVEGIAPGYAARQRYQRQDLPMAQRNAQIEQQGQDAEAARLARIGQMTGINPLTNEPTEEARHRLAVEQETAARNRQAEADRLARLAEAKRWHDATGGYRDRKQLGSDMNAWLRNIAPYGTLTPEMRLDFADRFGFDLPDDFDPRKHQLIDTGQGWARVPTTGSGQATAVMGADNKPLPSAKAMQADWAMKRTQALISAGNSRQAAELQVRREIADANREAAGQRQDKAIASRGKKGGGRLLDLAGGQTPKRTITRADYDARVKQHGQAKVDEQLKRLGISVE